MRLTGSLVALITPFTEDGAVDYPALEKLVNWHIAEGTHGLVPCGTTGESATLSFEEHCRVVATVVDVASNRVPVIAGTGSNNTAEAVLLTQAAEKAGADGALLITPYYNKPTQEGLYQHFRTLHDASSLPLILYDVPSRTVTKLDDATIIRLAALPRIIGVKDATGDLERPTALRQALPDFTLISGEDGSALAFCLQGGEACISVTANVAPRLCAQQFNAWQRGDIAQAQQIHRQLFPLHKAMFIESSPAPAKYAASLLGLCNPYVRLPLVQPTSSSAATILAAMHHAGLC